MAGLLAFIQKNRPSIASELKEQDIVRHKLAAAFGCGLLVVAMNAHAQQASDVQRPDIKLSPVDKTSVETFQRIEWRIDLGRTYDNPFDSDQIAVDAQFTGPGNQMLSIPAFWNKTAAVPDGAFFVRFMPPVPGDWSLVVTATDPAVKRSSASQSFTATAGKSPGMVRVADNRRYLKYDNGQSYFPVGINLSWAPKGQSNGQGTDWYESMFGKLASNGGNFARVWMADPPTMLETAATGQRKYDLKSAEYFDRVLELAEQRGVKVMLCFLNHREWIDRDMWGPAGWPTNPYNAVNGGPAKQPTDFFTNEAAVKQFKVRLRYMVARYGSYTSLGFWELCNEQENAKLPIPAKWDIDLAAYIRELDPYKHPVSTSANVSDEVWASPEMAVTQSHIYGDGTQLDMVAPVAPSVRNHLKFDKPHLLAEFGIDYHGGDYSFDRKGKATAFHNSLWSATMSGSAGTAMYWWWDNYVDSKNLWNQFKPISDFASKIDWANKKFAPVEITDLQRKDAGGAFIDLTLNAAGDWPDIVREPVTIPANGRPLRPVTRFLRGPLHQHEYAPLILKVNLPQPSDLVINARSVSDYGMLRVSIDGNPAGDFAFSALPGGSDTINSTFDQQSGFCRADVKGPRSLPTQIPAGKHEVKFDLVAGDWITFSSITFTHALDARFANLNAMAIQDDFSRETLVWILDTRSNWKDDQAEDAPPPMEGVQFAVPKIDRGSFTAEWWDTRTGQIVRTDKAVAADGKLIVTAPTFTRDIALRLQASEQTP